MARPKGEPTTRIVFRIKEKKRKLLEEKAEREGVDLSTFVRMCIDACLGLSEAANVDKR